MIEHCDKYDLVSAMLEITHIYRTVELITEYDCNVM